MYRTVEEIERCPRIGGFTAFPGAAVVGVDQLAGLPKALSRAVVQPYIIMPQIFSLILIALLHPNYLSYGYWMLLAITLPAVLPGTATRVMLYRRISDVARAGRLPETRGMIFAYRGSFGDCDQDANATGSP